MKASQAITDIMTTDKPPDSVDFSWWNNEQLIAYYDSQASKILGEDDYESLTYELEKRGLV